jgi:hypothetical protein
MPQDDKVMINTQIEIAGHTLQQIVSMAKQLQGPDARGHFNIDTADLVSDLISRFLIDGRFDDYVADQRNYEKLL